MSGHFATVASLQNLCIYEISKHFERLKFELKYVPIQIKDMLLRIAGHRLNLLEDLDLLNSLVHPYVEEITLTECTVNDRMLQAVEACPRLKKFQTGDMFKNVTFEGFARLFPKIPNLEYLVVKKCDVVNDQLVDIMSKSCPKIVTLDLSYSNITDSSMTKISMLKMTALTLSGTNITDQGIIDLLDGKCAETLRELNVCQCPISNITFLLVLDMCKNISVFTLRNTMYSGDIPPPNTNNLRQLAWTIV